MISSKLGAEGIPSSSSPLRSPRESAQVGGGLYGRCGSSARACWLAVRPSASAARSFVGTLSLASQSVSLILEATAAEKEFSKRLSSSSHSGKRININISKKKILAFNNSCGT